MKSVHLIFYGLKIKTAAFFKQGHKYNLRKFNDSFNKKIVHDLKDQGNWGKNFFSQILLAIVTF